MNFDRAPTELAVGLAADVSRAPCAIDMGRYECRRQCAGQSIRPGRVGTSMTRQWVPRSPPHRAGTTRQVEYDRTGKQASARVCVTAVTLRCETTPLAPARIQLWVTLIG
jgi:hypothetical protein